jgi:hypothetical protein
MPAPVWPYGWFGLNLLTTSMGSPVRMITACLVSGTTMIVENTATIAIATAMMLIR